MKDEWLKSFHQSILLSETRWKIFACEKITGKDSPAEGNQ